MSARVIYLDQWAWIHLSQEFYGKRSCPDLRRALEFIQAARNTGVAKFPLSLAHYFETRKRRDADSRGRLMAFMAGVSGFDTIASPDLVVAHEIDASLRVRFGSRVTVKPLQLLGKGVGHAMGRPMGFRIDDPSNLLTPEERRQMAVSARGVFEFEALLGPIPTSALHGWSCEDEALMHSKVAEFDDQFVRTLQQLPQDIDNLLNNELVRNAYLCRRCLEDIRAMIESRIAVHGISWEEFQGMGPVELMRFVYRMPSRRVDLHLMHLFAKNRQLKREPHDLNDFAYLGLASAYCDVVVAEGMFTDLVNRRGLDKKAIVISSLRELPNV